MLVVAQCALRGRIRHVRPAIPPVVRLRPRTIDGRTSIYRDAVAIIEAAYAAMVFHRRRFRGATLTGP